MYVSAPKVPSMLKLDIMRLFKSRIYSPRWTKKCSGSWVAMEMEEYWDTESRNREGDCGEQTIM